MEPNGRVIVCVRDAILARNNYCVKPNTEPDSHSGSWIHNGLGNRAPWNTLEYDLMTAISIRPLTQPMMCETGLPIFAAMVQLKVASNTSASLPIIPSTERTNRENVSFNRSRSAHTCPSWFYPNLTTTYIFWLISESPRQHLQTWCQQSFPSNFLFEWCTAPILI